MVPWRRGLDHGQGGPWGAARRLVEAKDSHDLSGFEWTDSDGILMDFHVHVHVWTEIYLDFMPRLCLTGLPSTKHDVMWQDFGRTISSRVWWIQQSALFERITLWLFGGHCSLVEPSKVCVTCVSPALAPDAFAGFFGVPRLGSQGAKEDEGKRMVFAFIFLCVFGVWSLISEQSMNSLL